jgi:hypothetical protein
MYNHTSQQIPSCFNLMSLLVHVRRRMVRSRRNSLFIPCHEALHSTWLTRISLCLVCDQYPLICTACLLFILSCSYTKSHFSFASALHGTRAAASVSRLVPLVYGAGSRSRICRVGCSQVGSITTPWPLQIGLEQSYDG